MTWSALPWWFPHADDPDCKGMRISCLFTCAPVFLSGMPIVLCCTHDFSLYVVALLLLLSCALCLKSVVHVCHATCASNGSPFLSPRLVIPRCEICCALFFGEASRLATSFADATQGRHCSVTAGNRKQACVCCASCPTQSNFWSSSSGVRYVIRSAPDVGDKLRRLPWLSTCGALGEGPPYSSMAACSFCCSCRSRRAQQFPIARGGYVQLIEL